MNILHLSDSPLSGSPVRISNLLRRMGVQSRHIAWKNKIEFREFEKDLTGSELRPEELAEWLNWADIIHYHNRWKRQEIFQTLGIDPPNKPSVIQIHSPRESEDFSQEVDSMLPIAIIAQYHVRQWPEASYVVPNVVDIEDGSYNRELPTLRTRPVVSFAPNYCTGTGWNDKGYGIVAPILKRHKFNNTIYFQLIVGQPHATVMALKHGADIGIDEIVTGSYHLNSLEYLALGVPCFANLDEQTTEVVKNLTGATELPWLKSTPQSFEQDLLQIVKRRNWQELGADSRRWMEKYWSPEILTKHYIEMYEDL